MESLEHLTDEQLIELVRDKDQELYAEIVKRFEKKLLRYAMSFTRDAHSAEDIVQNAFIKAFINLQGFDSRKKFSSWIYRITHNETMNEIRKNKHTITFDEAPEVESIPSKDVSADKAVEHEQMRAMLHQSLDELPVSYRAPLVLAYLEERSYQEISDILRLPMGTVGTRINRGKAILKSIYLKKNNNEHPLQ